MSPSSSIRACLLPQDWPEEDRLAWERAIAPVHGPFRTKGGRVSRNRYTRKALVSCYGRWVGFLRHSGLLDPAESPDKRPTPERLDAYFVHLRDECGNADQTLVSRFVGLRTALQRMYPGVDFRHITHPGGVSIRSRLPMIRKEGIVPDAAVQLEWAEELFAEALTLLDPTERRLQVREAVMIAVQATRAPRLRAFASLRIGVHLRREGDGWILDQTPDITKRTRRHVLPLSPEVAVMLDRYLAVERIELLDGRESDALWISTRRGPLAEGSISHRIPKRAVARYGERFGTHRFRASLATQQALDAPENMHDASVLLDHRNAQTTRDAYIRASSMAAARRHSDRLKRLRRR
jgi:integrase